MIISRRLLLFIAAILVVGVISTSAMAVAATLPTEIRVGLSYGKSAWSTASFTGSKGLSVGTGEEQLPLWTSQPAQRLTVIGDGYRLEVGRASTPAEADQIISRLRSAQISSTAFQQPDGTWSVRVGHSSSSEGLAVLRFALISKGFSPLKEIGSYRLELQESYTSRDDVDKRVTALGALGLPAYPAYQSGWRVWVGDSTESEISALRTAVETAIPGVKTTLVNPYLDRLTVLDQTGRVALIYANHTPVAISDGVVTQRADNYRVELGPYTNILAANHAQQELISMGYPAYRVKSSAGYWLWVGDCWELGSAQEIQKTVAAKNYPVKRLVGPYRLVSFTSFSTRDAAQSRASQLSAKGLETTVLYENGWRVAVGNAATDGERDALRKSLATAAVLEPYVEREIDGGRMQTFDSNGNLIALLQIPNERKEALRLWPQGGGDLYSVEKKDRYPGVFEFRQYYHGGLTVINHVGVEDYVAGVAAKEMYPSWPLEALKAQAVASRSYVTTRMGNVALSQWGCDVDDTTLTQVYTGLERAGLPSIQKAVKETAGQYAWYGGQIATTYFHADGGGHTENVENVWSSVVPYLRGVPEMFPSEGPNSTWQESMTGEEIRQALIRNGRKDIGLVRDMVIEQAGVSGAPTRLRVVGTKGEDVLIKGEARAVFGFFSSNFTITKPGAAGSYYAQGNSGASVPLTVAQATVIGSTGKIPLNMVSQPKIQGSVSSSPLMTSVSDKFVFNGRGHGHGAGMSQWGAKAMADRGYTYIQILQHYYQGIIIK